VNEWPGQERLAALVELGADAVVLIDADGIIRWASASVTQVVGFEPADLVGTGVRQLISPEDPASWQGLADTWREQPAVTHAGTFRCRHRDGLLQWRFGTARNMLAESRIGAIVLSLRDATPSESDGAAKATEDRYRHLFEDATDVVFETDHEGFFRLVNPALLRALGYSEGEVIGRRFTDFIRADYRETVFEHYRRQGEARERTSYIEFPALTRDRGEIWLGQNACLFVDAAGGFGGIRAIARDITESRHSDESLRQTQKMEAVGRLAGGIAHDFNNLLTAIRGNAELLSHRLKHDPARAAEVEEILHASDRAATLTRQLLVFSRKQELAPVVLDLNRMVEAVARLSRRLLGPDVTIEIEVSDALEPIVADPTQAEQLVLNLILNARDALPSGGRIIARTSNRQLADGTPEAERAGLGDGMYVRLEVIDDGIGMDQATQARIFEPFFTTKEPGRGTGLGLSTVYGLVRQMGGSITVESERNHGATFTVYLPAATRGRASASTPASSGQEV
jgi:PAS domain S-box-containing protein